MKRTHGGSERIVELLGNKNYMVQRTNYNERTFDSLGETYIR